MLLFRWAGSRPVKTTLAIVPPWITVSSINLCAATPVLLIAIARQSSPSLRPLLKEPVNALQQQTASAEIPMASEAKLRHISRGFLPRRFAYAGPPVCAAPPSWGRHPQTFTLSGLMHRNKILFNHAIGKRKQRTDWRHRSGAFTSSSDSRWPSTSLSDSKGGLDTSYNSVNGN